MRLAPHPFTSPTLAVALAMAALAPSATATAKDYLEPATGSELRADLMDTLRPHIEWKLGSPVEFVVWDLRVAGDVAFGQVLVQRPGGAAIDIESTPMVTRDGADPEFIDGTRTEAFYRRAGRQWVAVHHVIGATDVWYMDPMLCVDWSAVMPLEGFCQD